jgi:hypothetical protein
MAAVRPCNNAVDSARVSLVRPVGFGLPSPSVTDDGKEPQPMTAHVLTERDAAAYVNLSASALKGVAD